MMNKPSVFIWVVLVLGFALAGGYYWYNSRVSSLPYYGQGRVTDDKSQAIPIPDLRFVNQEHDTVSLSQVGRGKVTVIDYFFTRCTSICPKMTANMGDVQKEFLNDEGVKIVSISCDPEFDQPTQLAAYAKRNDVRPAAWSMGTGDKPTLYGFARNALQIVATQGNGDGDDFIHSPYAVLVDREGYIRGYYDATDKSSIRQLIIDIKKLL